MNNMYQCSHCPKGYIWEDSLKRHIKNKHMISTQPMEFNQRLDIGNGAIDPNQTHTVRNKPLDQSL